MSYVPFDKWALRAQKEGYAARSAYKLVDIDCRFHVFKKGDLVLDLGCAPGSWIQVAADKIGTKGFIIGVDLEPLKIKKPLNLSFIKKDIYDQDLNQVINKVVNPDAPRGSGLRPERRRKKFDIVLSDLSPKTTGQKDIDQWKAHELALKVLDIIKIELKKSGRAVIKVFEGPDTPEIIKLCKEIFKRVHLIKPMASTKGSKETYIVAIDKKSFLS